MSETPSILVVANTPFQIVVACHILQLYYPQADVDLCISNGIRDAENIVKHATETEAFRNVIFLRNRKCFAKGPLNKLFAWLSYIISNYRISFSLAKNTYDILLFSNISVLTKLLTTKLSKYNSQIKIQIFEEGMSTYTQRFADGDAPNTLYRRWVDKKGILDSLDRLYVFNPFFLAWKPINGHVQELPKISSENADFRQLINQIFDYAHCQDKYDKKLIFFEESHALEGYDVPDIEIVEQIAIRLGKDNIMVKTHPRNPINRFARLGYKTNINTAIPWEVIMLNEKLTDKILVTISSGSVIYPYLYLNIAAKSYSLIRCLKERPGLMKGEMGNLMETIYETYPDIFRAPKSFDVFYKNLEKDIQCPNKIIL